MITDHHGSLRSPLDGLTSRTIPSQVFVRQPRAPASIRRTNRPVTCEAVSSPKPLVIVGSLNADSVLDVERLPEPGETMSAKTMATFPGGKVSQMNLIQPAPNLLMFMVALSHLPPQGSNQAAAAGLLGHPTYMLGQVQLKLNSSCSGFALL